MWSKGLWRHVEGKVVEPAPYAIVNRVLVTSDGKTPATEDQIKACKMWIIDFNKREYLTQRVILSTTSMCLGAKIKDLPKGGVLFILVIRPPKNSNLFGLANQASKMVNFAQITLKQCSDN
jgi:hypothetical protein